MDDKFGKDRVSPLNIAITMALSVMLSRLSFGSLVFCVPLLVLCNSVRKKIVPILVFTFTALIIAGMFLYQCRESLAEPENLGLILVGLIFPVTGCLGCAVWFALKDFSDNVLRKLVICSFFTSIITLAFVIWISRPEAGLQRQTILIAYKSVIPVELLKGNADTFLKMILSIIILMMVPFGIFFSGFQILLSELFVHRHDEKWQYDFAYMKMPNYYVWFFLVFWIAALSGNFIKTVPEYITVIGWNFALGISAHYFLSGISILTALLRRHSATLTAANVFVYVMISCFVPVVNMIVFSVLVLMGAAETWFKFR